MYPFGKDQSFPDAISASAGNAVYEFDVSTNLSERALSWVMRILSLLVRMGQTLPAVL
jgi:hypothetical protein